MKRRRRVDDARDESSDDARFDHSSAHADLGSLLDAHSYGAEAEASMRAWLETRRRPDGNGSAEPPPATRDDLQSIVRTLAATEAERAERTARPDPVRPDPARSTTPVVAR